MQTTKLIALIVLLGALLAGGCASPSQPTAMVAAPVLAPEARHEGSVAIQVTGGSKTSAAGASQISNEDFFAALSESIEKAGLFQDAVAAGEKGDYRLDVAIVRVQQPLMGFSMTVTIETTWNLTKASDGQVVWRKAIVSSYTAAVSDAFAGVTRLRLANEGAARKNIEDAITQMGALSLN